MWYIMLAPNSLHQVRNQGNGWWQHKLLELGYSRFLNLFTHPLLFGLRPPLTLRASNMNQKGAHFFALKTQFAVFVVKNLCENHLRVSSNLPKTVNDTPQIMDWTHFIGYKGYCTRNLDDYIFFCPIYVDTDLRWKNDYNSCLHEVLIFLITCYGSSEEFHLYVRQYLKVAWPMFDSAFTRRTNKLRTLVLKNCL